MSDFSASVPHNRIANPPLQLFGAGLLLISATETDSLVGLLLAIPQMKMVSMLWLVLFALYILAAPRTARSLLRAPIVRLWIMLLSAVPIGLVIVQTIIGFYPPDQAVYWIGVLVLTGLCFFVAVLWARKASDQDIVSLIQAILLVSTVGFLVQYLSYDLIRRAMTYSSNVLASSSSTLRLLGFYAHPNVAAISLVVLPIPLLTACNRSDGWTARLLVLMGAAGIGILATGSRTSFALLLLVGTVFTAYSSLFIARRAIFTRNVLFLAILLLASLAMAAALLPYLTDIRHSIGLGLARLGQLLDPIFGGSNPVDASAALRANIIAPYLALSMESPFIGYGHSWLARQIGTATLPTVSQNSWIQWLIEYGYPFMFFVAFVFLRSIGFAVPRLRSDRSDLSRSAFGLALFLLVTLVAMLSINDIFFHKSVLIVFGLLTGKMIRDWRGEQDARPQVLRGRLFEAAS